MQPNKCDNCIKGNGTYDIKKRCCRLRSLSKKWLNKEGRNAEIDQWRRKQGSKAALVSEEEIDQTKSDFMEFWRKSHARSTGN